MSVVPSSRKAVTGGVRLPGGRLYDAVDALCWIAGLNILILVFALLGGVVFGLAPALVAGFAASRARARGDALPLIRTFAGTWRRELVRANLLAAPFAVAAALLTVNLLTLTSDGGPLAWALRVALGAVALAATIALTLYCHYELPLRRYALTAVRYMLHDLPASALIVVVTAIAAVAGAFAPGLIPVLLVGAWVHAVGALTLSFYTRNDELVAAQTGE